MQTKFTLRLDKQLVEQAKKYASSQGKSVSKMVADYFVLFKEKADLNDNDLAPISKSLKGSLENANLDESKYKLNLEKKHLSKYCPCYFVRS